MFFSLVSRFLDSRHVFIFTDHLAEANSAGETCNKYLLSLKHRAALPSPFPTTVIQRV